MSEQDLSFTEQNETHTARLGRPKKIQEESTEPKAKVQEPAKHVDKTEDYKTQRRNEMIRGRFNYVTKPGATLQFNCFLDEGDSEKHIKIKDGEIKPLKRKQAMHLNESGKVPVYHRVKDANGCEQSVFSHYIKRWFYENYDFFEIEEMGV